MPGPDVEQMDYNTWYNHIGHAWAERDPTLTNPIEYGLWLISKLPARFVALIPEHIWPEMESSPYSSKLSELHFWLANNWLTERTS